MDWQIRIALLILGLIVIAFILWDFKKRKQQQKEKQRLIDQMHQSAEGVDSTGFDFTGVGNVRRAGNEPTLSENIIQPEVNSASDLVPEPKPEPEAEQAAVELESKTEVAKPQVNSHKQEEPSSSEPVVSLQEPELVIALILKADEATAFSGRDFMPLLLSQGLRHGDMGIFHRHSGASGKPGPVMYSVANAINPGTFDLKNIEQFETPAFAFFVSLPGPDSPMAAFEAMVATAKMLQKELGGQLMDDSKSVYTEQTYHHQQDRVSDHLRQMALKK